jgi:hypothetical protein
MFYHLLPREYGRKKLLLIGFNIADYQDLGGFRYQRRALYIKESHTDKIHSCEGADKIDRIGFFDNAIFAKGALSKKAPANSIVKLSSWVDATFTMMSL